MGSTQLPCWRHKKLALRSILKNPSDNAKQVKIITSQHWKRKIYPSENSSFSFRNEGSVGKYGSDALFKWPPNNQTKKVKFKKTFGWAAMKKFVSPLKQRWKREIDFRYQWKKSFRSKDNIFKSNFKFHNPNQLQTQAIFWKAWKQLTSKQSKLVAEGKQKTEFMNPNNFKQDKN